MSYCIFRRYIYSNRNNLFNLKNYQNIKTIRYVKTQPRPYDTPRHDETKSWGRSLWKKMFGKYLLTTNIVSSAILMAAGDIISQEIEYEKEILSERYDWHRIGKLFVQNNHILFEQISSHFLLLKI